MKFGLTNLRADLGGNYLAGEGEDGIPVIKMGNIGRGEIQLRKIERLPREESFEKEHLLAHGDFLFNTRNSLDLVGKVAVWRGEIEPAVYNSNILRVRFDNRFLGNPYFAGYLFNSSLVVGLLRLSAKGTTSVAAIYYKDLRRITLALPLLNEQNAITKFLDYETAKIDVLIEKQQRLIALLKEKRQAVISHVVTKGLNPDAPMRDSGIEWLGEVPAHWTVCGFSHAVYYQEGPGIMATDFHDDGVPLVRISGVKGRWVTLDGCNFLNPNLVARRWGHFRLEKGDLVISASASMGIVAEVNDDAAGAVPYTGLIRLLPRDGQSVKGFVRSLVVSDVFMKQIDLLKAGATIQHFGPTHLRQVRIARPPLDEQEEIASYIDTQVEYFGALTAKTEGVIELLQERRTALITAAVTGKIDVRGWQTLESEVEAEVA